MLRKVCLDTLNKQDQLKDELVYICPSLHSFFLIEFIGVTLVHKTICISGVQLNKTSPASCVHPPKQSLFHPHFPSIAHLTYPIFPCDSMKGPADCYAKWNKPVKERQVADNLTCMWNLMNKINWQNRKRGMDVRSRLIVIRGEGDKGTGSKMVKELTTKKNP